MKKLAIISVVILIAGLLVLRFGKIPTYPMDGELKYLKITSFSDKGVKEYNISEKQEIATIQEACGLVWMDTVPAGSLEGRPSWRLELHYKDGQLKEIYIDEDEFNGSRHSKGALVEFLRENYG